VSDIPEIDVLPATADDLRALRGGVDSVRRWRVEPGYLEWPEALDGALATLADGTPPEWATHLIVHRADEALIGLGGFKGVPVDGVVEVGYGIAPAYRGRGFATEATRALVAAAAARGVSTVRAHTLPEKNASTAVLARAGFAWVSEVVDPDDGPIWRWERPAA
jgi:ribosomal-protein-alanine N-acetyltransferase